MTFSELKYLQQRTQRVRSVLFALFSFSIVVGSASNAVAAEEMRVRVFEAYPDEIRLRIQERGNFLAGTPASDRNNLAVESVISFTSKWKAGQTLRIAFSGGDSALHKEIADIASEWIVTNRANLKFDFGFDATMQTYRLWTKNDRFYGAEVRVSFNHKGYWSCVGRDSVSPNIASPNEASLNLEGFPKYRPADWAAVVLHEFGHAIGFEHEHQHPADGCDAEFRWEDDTGYVNTTNAMGQFIQDPNNLRPGIYTTLGGWPNNWDRQKVDFNLKQLPNTSAYVLGKFDKTSIMMYSFDAWMFIKGAQSSCYSEPNLEISPYDEKGAASVYPWRSPEVARVNTERVRLATMLSKSVTLPPKMIENYKTMSR